MYRISLVTFSVFVTMISTAWAQTPRDVDDLVDMRAGSGERELEDRGYRHRKTLTIKDDEIDYWWSSRKDQCIAVTTRDGYFNAIFSQPESMCDENNSGSHSSHGGKNDLDDLVDMRAGSGERELEDMGYHHRKTVNFGGGKIVYWWNSRRDHCVAVNINDGRFTAVTDQSEVMCDEGDVGSSGHGGGHGLDHIVGMRASSGEKELEDLGYKFKNSSKGDDRIWSNWWNRHDRKCITVVTMDGRYDSITDSLPFDCGKD